MRLHKVSLSALALALAGATSAATAATHLEVQGGRSYMDSHGTPAAFVEATFDAHPISGTRFSWAPDVSVGWIGGRDMARYKGNRYQTGDDIFLVAGGARLRYGSEGDWYHGFFYSLQGALQTGRSMALSSVGEFVNTVGWQGKYLSFQVRHISNGGTHGPNRGETMALVGVGFDL